MADLQHDPAVDVTGATTIIPPPSQSILCFPTPERPRRSRAKFTTEEREKVLRVRRQGACLRCRILKIQCSLDNPCQPCLQSAVRGAERRVLSFCYCVRTRFADVNIFERAATMQTETLLLAMSNLLARIAAPAQFQLALASSPSTFNSTMVTWLTDPDFRLPNGSLVGLCCSSLLGLQFQDDEASVDGLLTDFRRFLLATSLVHAGWRGRNGGTSGAAGATLQTRADLCAAGHAAGGRLLRRLDRVLTPQFLARCGREACQVLFLLVLGAVLGVRYASSSLLLDGDHHLHQPLPPAAAEMLSPEFRRSPTLWLAMKEHLCQMLAHHLIFVGSMLGIRLDTAMEQRIIDTAVRRWNKAEEFVWAEVVDPSPGGEQLDPGSERGPSATGSPETVKREDEDEEVEDEGRSPRNSNPPPVSRLGSPRLVPIQCPEVSQFQPPATDGWADNPASYLAMFEEPESCEPSQEEDTPREKETQPSNAGCEQRPERQEYMWPRETKRRSIWIVRPFDAGPGLGLKSAHARLRGNRDAESLRAFV